MKLNRKTRLGAFLLAVLFLVQTVLGLLSVHTVQADASAIEHWDENALLDYGYRFNVKYQPGITKAETFGCDNLDKEAFTNHGRSERNADTVRMTGTYTPESAGVRYYNVGRDGEGNIVDFKLTLVNVVNPEPRYDLQTVIARKNADKGNGTTDGAYDWKDNLAQPLVGFSLEGIGMYIYCVDSAQVHFQFLKHNTEEPLSISGHGTVRDLDAGQGVTIPQNSFLDHVYIVNNNDFLIVDGMKVTAPNESLTSGDKRGWLNMVYNTDSMYFDFVHRMQLDRWDTMRADGIAKEGSVENWAENIRNRYRDADGRSYCPNFDGGKFMRGHAYFDFTSYCFGGIEMRKPPEKRIGAAGCTWEDAAGYTREEPYIVKEFEEFQYMVQAEVTPNQFKRFVLSDTLEECLKIDDVSKISITDDTGLNVTENFDIQTDGRNIVCSAKAEVLAMESFSNNHTYTFTFVVHRNQDADVAAYTAPDRCSILVPNRAELEYERVNGTGDSMTSEEVWVRGVIPPELEISKTASKYEWAAGDIITYTVALTQKKENTGAMDVKAEDALPPYLQMIEGSYTLEAPGVENCRITETGENGWRLECPFLAYGQTITMSFQCRATEEANGQEGVNIVTATAGNLVNTETGEQESVKDMAEVWINSPRLTIDKTADKYEWYVGEEISYRIVVNNTVPGTIARNVQITDISLPEGLILSGGSQSVEILDVMQQVDYPVPDQKTGQTFETVPVESRLEGDERGFAFYCSHLPYNHPVTILFHCTAAETANARESVNAASAVAENAAEISDDAEVFVNSGEFWIEKTADHYEWQLGEQVAYTVVIENKMPGTIARNVTVWDTSMPAGLALASPDSVIIEGIPGSITQPVAGTPDVPAALNPEFYQETAQKNVAYEFVPEGAGWRMAISDLPAGLPVSITFLCTVTEEVNGMESINSANVQAENVPVQEDDAEIYVNTAVLSLKKAVLNPYLAIGDGREKNEFRVGEQVSYQVTLENLQKGSIAKNIVLSDLSLPEGLALDGDEDALAVSGIPLTILHPAAGTDDAGNILNPENYNEVVEKQVDYQLLRQGTGWILTISDLPYHMPVTVNFRCTVQEDLNGLEVVNTAAAYADNAAEVKSNSKVWINSPVLLVNKKADKPFYKYGDVITYRVVLTQEQPGCVARNVTLSDVIETPGVRLLKDSIVLLDEKGNLINPSSVEANDNNSFFISTERCLVKDARYTIYDGTQGGASEQVLLNPLDIQGERQMIVEYSAAVIDEGLAGRTVHNVSTGNSFENIPSVGEETVEVHSPILEIIKTSDKKQYRAGEKGYYTVTVRQLREDVTADNIVIEDIVENGALINKDSIVIKKNGEWMENVKTEASDTGFRVITETPLSDRDKLEICYEVMFQSAQKGGSAVCNTAKAWADGTPEVFCEHEVYVEEIQAPSPSPMPDPTPVPTVIPSPVPMATPIPTASACPRITPAPTRNPGLNYNNNNNLNGGNLSGNSDFGNGTGTSYGNYRTGGAKTGDVRPFAKIAKLGLFGLLLMPGGVFLYKKARRSKNK